ncbi:MAG: OadG family protein [Gammaproteobacteria bacterium]|jgi:oxaloacetate decarboxylase gamma subunit|nr:OadG family protein [Gammaproteobacteria bacterium]
MTSGQLLLEGLELMLIGMSLVFVFLILLIGCIHLISVVLQRATVHESVALVATRSPAGPVPDADTLAAIQAALHQHHGHRAR